MDNINLDTHSISVDDTFRILIATDCHLGYAENDQERCDDSFNSFEEILQLAKHHEVDFILLGGDLFHENKPSTHCLHKCLALLRKYCLGDKPISVQFLSDQDLNFQHCSQRVVNYLDPNLNVSIPVFSIHGNHDDPSGHQQLCSLDILSTSGLVNYFGKWTNLTEVKISPILLQKGNSKLALYGLSHIKDERLSRLFRDNKVHLYRPDEETEDWFNIFVCHQNRADRGVTKHLPEEDLPNFLDLVMWGHEHECRLKEEWNVNQEFFVTQPGSSVATSLCEGEAKPKFVGLLHVYNKKFKLQPLPLKTVRPFIFETITLSECTIPRNGENKSTRVQQYLSERLEFWIAESRKQLTGHEKQPVLPLVRVRVEYKEEEEAFNVIRFGQQFQSKVANPTDMILLKREKIHQKKTKSDDTEDKECMEEFLQNEVDDIWEVKMTSLMQKYFDEISKKKLQILSIKGISNAASRFIDKSDKETLSQIIEHQTKKVKDHLCKKKADVHRLDEEIEKYKLEKMHNSVSENEEVKRIISNVVFPPKIEERDVILDSDDERMNEDVSINEDAISNIRGRGRGSRSGRRGQATTTRARGRARGSRSATTTTTSRQSSRASTRTTTPSSRFQYDDSDDD